MTIETSPALYTSKNHFTRDRKSTFTGANICISLPEGRERCEERESKCQARINYFSKLNSFSRISLSSNLDLDREILVDACGHNSHWALDGHLGLNEADKNIGRPDVRG